MSRLGAMITDPATRRVAQWFATGQLSARDVVDHLERSPRAMRGFDRYVNRLVRLSPEEREAMRAEHERRVAEVAAELAATGRDVDEEEAPWEDGSWLR